MQPRPKRLSLRLLDEEASKLRILDYLRTWLGDELSKKWQSIVLKRDCELTAATAEISLSAKNRAHSKLPELLKRPRY